MTGIQRLRKIIEDYRAGRECDGFECTELSCGKCMAKNVLEPIADQIERESDVETVRSEAMEAWRWVREHGGLEKIKLDALCWNTAENIAQTTLDWLARVCPVAGIEKCGYGVALERLEDAINRRLMPEGMEWLLDVWPKWSNGEYCKFGDWWKSDKYGEPEPNQFSNLSIYTPEQLREWGQDDGDNYGYEWDFVRPSDPKYRPDKAEPPAPKVLDADGVEIREGDEVWHVETGEQCKVVEVDSRSVSVDFRVDGDGTKHTGSVLPANLTHRAPVLAADGRPLREGETVWTVKDGYEATVTKVGDGFVDFEGKDGGFGTACSPSDQLTHERPVADTWERLEEDARSCTCVMEAINLVRRAKKLAGVSE